MFLFSSEVTAALRISDGAIVVVDVVSGVSNQTETVLRQALTERIKPVLVINKLDRAILEQQLEPEVLYEQLTKIISNVNYLISVYTDSEVHSEAFKCDILDPTKGNVAFASGRDGWAFTLSQFAEIYESKKKKATCSALVAMSGKLGFHFKVKENEAGVPLSRLFMKKWLPASDALLELIVFHLPSPVQAQAYRVSSLYEGKINYVVRFSMYKHSNLKFLMTKIY